MTHEPQSISAESFFRQLLRGDIAPHHLHPFLADSDAINTSVINRAAYHSFSNKPYSLKHEVQLNHHLWQKLDHCDHRKWQQCAFRIVHLTLPVQFLSGIHSLAKVLMLRKLPVLTSLNITHIHIDYTSIRALLFALKSAAPLFYPIMVLEELALAN